jgi:hypothetical protein
LFWTRTKNPVLFRPLLPDMSTTPNVAHSNSMLGELRQQYQEKIQQLESKIQILEEEIRIIQEYNDRLDDL